MSKRNFCIGMVMVALAAPGAFGCGAEDVGGDWEGEGRLLRAHRPDISVSKEDNTQAQCEEIERLYTGLTKRSGICRVDDDCQMLQGQCGVGLGGCYEFVNQSIDQGDLDALGHRFFESGCAGGVCSCLPPYFDVYCEEGRCVGEFEGFSPTCDDLADEQFGPCAMFLGYGVVDGSCQPISGCSGGYFNFFDSMEECEAACLDQPYDDHCDDGSNLMCLMPIPHCGPGEIPAVKNGCYECVNEITCQPWGEAGCRLDRDCRAGQICDYCATASCYECDDCVPGCVDKPVGHGCNVNGDCRLHSDYCGGCNCIALAPHEEPLACIPEEQVLCIVDPCMNKQAVCALGRCHATNAEGPSITPTFR